MAHLPGFLTLLFSACLLQQVALRGSLQVLAESLKEPGSGAKTPIPVFVMLPLDILDDQHKVHYGQGSAHDQEVALGDDLRKLSKVGVQGVMVDCWWGKVEAEVQGQYEWEGYKRLFSIVYSASLELHVVMSFHACGNGVGDNVEIPLPNWVTEIGKQNPDIFYKDAGGIPDYEYLSLAVDNQPVLNGLTPLQVYYNFMFQFSKNMKNYFAKSPETKGITTIEVGLGPSGELRYPAYRLRWKFDPPPPGVGEFQCYDKYMMKSWEDEATKQGLSIPCRVGPQTAGDYSSTPNQTQFFRDKSQTQLVIDQKEINLTYGICYWDKYGKAFLTWYSKNLVDHGNRVLQTAKRIFQSEVKIAAKVPGIHWWYDTESHAAEATAGLFNGVTDNLSVYKSIADTLEVLRATFIFTCAELSNDGQKKANAACDPEKLVKEVMEVAGRSNVSRAAENALEAYDKESYNRIIRVADTHDISYFTYMRLGPNLMDQTHLAVFKKFVEGMEGT
ncbi:unnamed protein product [Sphagnum troendelagicum]|uniref:Beta-amylase n=1 Tax=Sphagnum troendelagicum TaxID=128251 RepID=A0ABP0TDR7_9BRYO